MTTTRPTRRASRRNLDPLLTSPFVRVTGAGLAYFMAIGVLVPAVPLYVEDELGGTWFHVGLSVGAFFVTAAMLRPFVGALGDRIGSRVLIVGGGTVLGTSLLVYRLADTLPSFVAVRALSGVGEAAIFIGASAAINELAPPARRGEALSYWSVAVYGGLGMGPLLGEAALDRGYGWVWAAAAGLCAVTVALGATAPTGFRTTAPFILRQLLHPAGLLPGLVLGLGLLGYAGFVAFMPLYAEELGLDGAGRLFLLYAALVLGIRMRPRGWWTASGPTGPAPSPSQSPGPASS